MKRASAWLFSLGLLGCGTSANPPVPTSAQQAGASTGSPETQTEAVDKPQPQEAPPPTKLEPEAPPSASVGDPAQPIPTVAGQLPALPDPSLVVVVTLEKIEVGDVTAALQAGILPARKSPPEAIADALLASEDPVAWVADASVPAATLHTLIGILPPERSRFLVMQTAKGQQGAVALASTVPAGAPYLRIAADGFHLAKQSGGKEYDIGPDPAGGAFNYVRLRDKVKAFRTRSPEVAGIRVGVDGDITVEVLARAVSQLRGPRCAEEPQRCWLPDVGFGDGIKTASGSPSKPKLKLSKPGGTSPGPGTVEIGKAKVGKGVDASKVDAVLKRRAGFARMCYFAALADSPKLAGTMALRLTVGEDGKVIEVGVPKSSLGDDAVEACLTRGLKGLRLAAPQKATVAIDVSLTFKLR